MSPLPPTAKYNNFDSITRHGWYFWILFFFAILACLLKTIQVLPLVFEFFKPQNSHLKSAFFVIFVWSSFVSIFGSSIWQFSHIFDPDNVNIVIAATITYGSLQNGFTYFLLGMNRVTALGYPELHPKIWKRSSILVVMAVLILFPFIIGSQFLFDPCMAEQFSMQCDTYQSKYFFYTGITNLIFCGFTLLLIVFAVYLSTQNYVLSQSKPMTWYLRKMDKRLVWLIVAEMIFIVPFYLTRIINQNLDSESRTSLNVASECLYILNMYPATILLFVVSPLYRERFSKFYRLNYIFNKNNQVMQNPNSQNKVITIC